MLHSHTGPSKAGLWLNCAAFREMSAIAPAQEDQHAAKEGRCCHEAAAIAVDSGVFTTGHLVGNEYEGEIFTKDLSEEVDVYTDYVKTQRDICVVLGGEYVHRTEKLVDLSWVHPKFFGTSDSMFILMASNCAEIIDLKMGRTIVEPDDPQLMCYALEVIHTYPAVTKVQMTIVQPRAPHIAGGIRSLWVTRDELLAFSVRAATMQEANYIDGQEATAGKHCTWCPAAGTCKAHMEYILSTVPIKNLRPDILTAEEVDNLLQHQKQVEVYFKRVAAYGLELARRGEPFKTMKLVKAKGRNSVEDIPVDQFVKMVKRISGVDVDLDAIAPRKLGALSKIREKYGDDIAKLLTKEGEEKLALVPLTDKNTAVAINVMDILINSPIPEFKK